MTYIPYKRNIEKHLKEPGLEDLVEVKKLICTQAI
jgi:hypothetical protein